ncbi:MAG: hypothetical protein PHD15_06605 [Clostridia bacterium]|nr:hypothetical protein [Clostridia bacterium]MDD4387401.1 hypothetical protein [Clostridia bacterium]
MNTIKKALPYLLIILIAFYVLPLFIADTGSGMFMLLLVIPVICVIVSLIYGKKEKFNILYSIIVAILFIPVVFIHFNDSALVYVLLYGIISLISNYVGSKI